VRTVLTYVIAALAAALAATPYDLLLGGGQGLGLLAGSLAARAVGNLVIIGGIWTGVRYALRGSIGDVRGASVVWLGIVLFLVVQLTVITLVVWTTLSQFGVQSKGALVSAYGIAAPGAVLGGLAWGGVFYLRDRIEARAGRRGTSRSAGDVFE
jgi:hypothetical protein